MLRRLRQSPQTASPPSYQADPEVYRVIFKDENFRASNPSAS